MSEQYYDDDAGLIDASKNLWHSVLLLAINDALHGPSRFSGGKNNWRRMIDEARTYITAPNKDFNETCSLAGLDPKAVRERVSALIAQAPSAEEIFAARSFKAKRRSPGVVSNFQAFEGTGGGSTLQESQNITFSEKTGSVYVDSNT